MRRPAQQRGFVLAMALGFMALIALVVGHGLRNALLQSQMSTHHQQGAQALRAAESGASRFLDWLLAETEAHGWPQGGAQLGWQAVLSTQPLPASGSDPTAVQALAWLPPAEVDWSQPHSVSARPRGQLASQGERLAEAGVHVRVRPFPVLPAALVLIGPVQAFEAPAQGGAQLDGGSHAPAVLSEALGAQGLYPWWTDLAPAAQARLTGSASDGSACPAPCVVARALGPVWSDPSQLQAWVAAWALRPDVQFHAGDLDTHSTPLDGRKRLLIVSGGLRVRSGPWVQDPLTGERSHHYHGRVLVLGGRWETDADASAQLHGQGILAHLHTTDAVWTTHPSGVQWLDRSTGGTGLAIRYPWGGHTPPMQAHQPLLIDWTEHAP
jgi:hypothetical protein